MLAAKPLNATRAVAMRATSGRVSAKARRSLVVRAVDETKNEEDVTGSTVFYAGNTYNSEEEVSLDDLAMCLPFAHPSRASPRVCVANLAH